MPVPVPMPVLQATCVAGQQNAEEPGQSPIRVEERIKALSLFVRFGLI
jgi:hypothetical protein